MTQEGKMGEWISVEKQLPDPVYSWGSNPASISEDVLCIWEESGEYGIAHYDCEETEWSEKTGADSYAVADCDPAHWMPLPSPPGAEKERP